MGTTAPPTSAPKPAPPLQGPGRRRSWRRWRPGTVTGLLVLACLSLMLLDVRGGPTDALRAAGRWLGGPLEAGVAGVAGATGDAVRRPDADALRDRIDRLAEQNQLLQQRNDELVERLATAGGAAEAARLAESLDRPAVTARVVAAESAPAAAAVTVTAGSAAGVRPGSAVLVPAGVVGRVTDVSPSTSTVQLVTDPASSVSTRLQASRQVALAQGAGAGRPLQLGHLDPLADVAPGQRVVTMGSPDDWPFPAGIPVGTVATVSGALGDVGRTVTAEPAAQLGTLDHVAILIRTDDGAVAGRATP